MNLFKTLLLIAFICIVSCKEPKEKETVPSVQEKPPIPIEAIEVTESKLARQIHASGVAAGFCKNRSIRKSRNQRNPLQRYF